VINVADGVSGLEMVVSGIRRPILEGRMQPILVFAIAASNQQRTQEYAIGRRRNPYWQRHADWFVDTVMPWAEANAGASTDPAQRGLGGYSNGADWAIALAVRRPDLFSHVLAHSPVNEVRTGIPDTLQGRWVISAGQQEGGGDVARLNQTIARQLGDRATRQCIGPWGHDGASWQQISPGSVAWLYQLGDAAAINSPTERDHCRTLRGD
jgi:S-formylglutathione hydrolase FrmB